MNERYPGEIRDLLNYLIDAQKGSVKRLGRNNEVYLIAENALRSFNPDRLRTAAGYIEAEWPSLIWEPDESPSESKLNFPFDDGYDIPFS
jgi:hypothetical protein